MSKADNNTTTPTARWPSYGAPGTALPLQIIPTPTPAPPAPSRRGLMAGSTAALLAGATVVNTTHAAPLEAGAAAGDDAELIRLCRAFLTEDAVIQAWNAGEVTEAVGEAAHDRWWGYMDEIEGLLAVTTEGLRIKAECSLRALEGEYTVDDLVRNVLAQVAGRSAT